MGREGGGVFLQLKQISVCAAGYEGARSPGRGCTRCRAGRFKAAVGNALCTDCLPGETSAAGATSCTACPAEQYNPVAGGTCTDCPTRKTTGGLMGQTECGKYNVQAFQELFQSS